MRCVAVDCSNMSSYNAEKYYSNSERSKALKLSQSNNMQMTSTSCTYQSANNSSPIHFNNPQAHSSPIEGNKSNNFVLLQSYDAFEAKSTLNINETSCTLHKSYKTVSTKSSPIARTMHNISNEANANDYMNSLSSHHNATFDPNQGENVEIQLHALAQNSSNKNKIEDIQTFNAKAIAVADNSKITYDISALNEHTKYDDTFLNKTDSSDIFQMGLNLKMFPKYITPYLNSLKLDFLQLVNNRTAVAAPGKQIIRGSKTVNDIIKNIKNILKLNINHGIETETKINKCSAVQFLTVDFNALNVLNRKLDGVYKKIDSVGLTINDKTKKNQSIHEKSITNISTQHYNDYMELSCSNRFLIDLEPHEPIGNDADDISRAENKSLDLSQRVREINQSISLSPPEEENSAVSNKTSTPSQKRSLKNFSLNNLVDLQDKEITTPDINLQATEFFPGTSTPVNNSNSNNTLVNIYNVNREEKTENRYFLRTCPKSTEHFIAPLRPTPVKRKSSRVKTNCNADVFVCKGTGKKKVVLQYKVHSVFEANSNELIKKISPESIDCENNVKRNTISVDISNVIPRQNDKPCRCGIFPSQVPPSWSNSLHKDIHQNLHKIQFKSQMPIDVISKINDNGFLYDIINVTTNSNNDKYLNSTLKNINQFINLELNYSKKIVKNLKHHSIFMAVNPNSEIIGYLETEPLKNACIFQNNELSENLIAVKFGVIKLWVVVKYRNNGVASNLLKQFCYGKNLNINDIAFAYHGGQGNSFIKKYFKNNSVLIY